MKWLWQPIKWIIRNNNPKSKIKWSLYGRVWREFGKPYLQLLVAGILFTTISAGAEAFSITLVKKVVDQVFIETSMLSLPFIGIQIIGAFAAKGLFGYLKTLVMTKAGLLGITNLRRRIYKHMMCQPIGYFHGTHTGHLVNHFTGLASSVMNLVTDNVIRIVNDAATLIMMLVLMCWYAPQMTIILVMLVPGILIPLVVITRKRNILTRTGFGVEADSITHITQSIEGVKTIQAFCNEGQELQRMNDIEDLRVSVHFKSAKLSGLQTPILEMMISVGLCLALLVGGYFITNGLITIGDLTAFLLALTTAYKPAKSLTGVNGGIQAGLIAAENLFAFMDRKPEIADTKDAVCLERRSMNVKLDNITFAYNPVDGEVLNDVSLDVMPGKICALVGQSGGGKSTIFNLLARFYDPQVGAVRINGKDIRKYTLKSLRENIASVSQDVFLFNGTVADNIRYGNPEATTEQIEAAAKAANAHQFIVEFPHRYNNFVGERGALLSGGQKQRVAIARAILKDAPILLLDEATSALDTKSEKLIQSALKALIKGRTTFVIAHRLSTVVDADTICVIKDGRIVEQGTDAELLARDGEYAKLKKAQFKEN